MLHERARHAPRLGEAWDPQRARAAIRAIVADTEAALQPDGTWPWHPLDREGADEPPHKSVYLGAAGVVWALWSLARSGHADLRLDPVAAVRRLHAAYLAAPDTGHAVPSLFLGEAGILLASWRISGDPAAAERLADVVASNADNPTREALWGAPGTLLAALHLHRATGAARWRDLVLASVDALWRTWQPAEAPGTWLWTQDLYGRRTRYLGAGHGFAGTAHALLAAADLLPEAQRATLADRCIATARATAVHDESGANWPPLAEPAPSGARWLVQWCHGAPGVLTGLAGVPAGRDAAFDALLARAGALVWHAGPLAKGPGLCHGTAGNGHAFLALHRRTGDPVWLGRARAFAMEAIAQSDAQRAAHGQRRHTLWTGDPGLAVALRGCLDAAPGLPFLDTID